MALSSAPDTLARCFFRGLPTNPPFRALFAALDDSGASAAAADASGGVVEGFDDGWVSPDAEVSVAFPLLLDKDAAEC